MPFAAMVWFVLENMTSILFEVTFDVISINLSALMGAFPLQRMKGNINLGKTNYRLMIGQPYRKSPLHMCIAREAISFKLPFI